MHNDNVDNSRRCRSSKHDAVITDIFSNYQISHPSRTKAAPQLLFLMSVFPATVSRTLSATQVFAMSCLFTETRKHSCYNLNNLCFHNFTKEQPNLLEEKKTSQYFKYITMLSAGCSEEKKHCINI